MVREILFDVIFIYYIKNIYKSLSFGLFKMDSIRK